MVNKKIKTRGQQKGFAIVTTLIISSIVLVLVGSLFYKFSVNGKDLAADANRKTALAIAEEASSGVLKYVSNKNNPTGKDDVARIRLARAPISDFIISSTTTDPKLFPGYVRSQSGAKTGYAKFKSATGIGEFEIKSEYVAGSTTSGSNNMKADIIAYFPAKVGATVVRDFSLKFDRTFPPISATGDVVLPPAPPTPPEPATACETAKADKATKISRKDKADKAKATKSAAKSKSDSYAKDSSKTSEQKASAKNEADNTKATYAHKADKASKAKETASKSSALRTTCTSCATQVATSVTTKAAKTAAKSKAKSYADDNTKTAEQKASKAGKAKAAKATYKSAVVTAATCTGTPLPPTTPPASSIAGFGVGVTSWTEVPPPSTGLLL